MGGGGHDAHGEDFRQKVWTLTGGPNCRPKHWKRNTAIAMFGVFLACIPVAMLSAKLEKTDTSPHVMPCRDYWPGNTRITVMHPPFTKNRASWQAHGRTHHSHWDPLSPLSPSLPKIH